MNKKARIRPDSGDVAKTVFNWNVRNTLKKSQTSNIEKKKMKKKAKVTTPKVTGSDSIWWQ